MTPSARPLMLNEDAVTVPGQRYALISMVGPEQPQKTEKWGIKIRGVFATKEEANAHVKEIMESDPMFDVYLVDMYRWLLFPPDRSKIEDVHYQEKYLEDMIRGHYENQKKAKQMFEERKKAVLLEGLDKHLLPEERIEPPAASDEVTPSEALEAMQTDVQPHA